LHEQKLKIQIKRELLISSLKLAHSDSADLAQLVKGRGNGGRRDEKGKGKREKGKGKREKGKGKREKAERGRGRARFDREGGDRPWR
jgi:hypothetical protein